jgi:hypothetical protein
MTLETTPTVRRCGGTRFAYGVGAAALFAYPLGVLFANASEETNTVERREALGQSPS